MYTRLMKGVEAMIRDSKSETVIMPRELTAENGAKYLLSGDFKESVILSCDNCNGSGQSVAFGGACEVCEGAGDYSLSVAVSWTTIKNIYAKAVEHLSVGRDAYQIQTQKKERT